MLKHVCTLHGIIQAKQITANTRIHVAATDGSSSEHKGCVSKAVAKGRDSEAVVNTVKKTSFRT